MNKKILSILVLVLIIVFGTKAYASLTFTTDAITGTTASTIDLGSGNDLYLQTNGGKVGIGTITPGSTLDVKGTLRLSGATSGYVGFAPAAAAGSTTYTLPSADGTSGQVLSTNASGVLSWATPVSGSGASARIAVWSGTSTLTSTSYLTYVATSANLSIGSSSLGNISSGQSNTVFGHSILTSAANVFQTTAIGKGALQQATTGSTDNTAIGFNAGTYNNAVTTSTNMTFVGSSTGLGSSTQRTNSTAIGFEATVDADNTVVLGSSAVTNVLMGSTALAKVKAGSLQLTTGAKPTCDATTRGTQWYVAGGAGVADTIEMCGKSAADGYSWVALGTF